MKIRKMEIVKENRTRRGTAVLGDEIIVVEDGEDCGRHGKKGSHRNIPATADVQHPC